MSAYLFIAAVVLAFMFLRRYTLVKSVRRIENYIAAGKVVVVWGHSVTYSPFLTPKEVYLLFRDARAVGIREVRQWDEKCVVF